MAIIPQWERDNFLLMAIEYERERTRLCERYIHPAVDDPHNSVAELEQVVAELRSPTLRLPGDPFGYWRFRAQERLDSAIEREGSN